MKRLLVFTLTVLMAAVATAQQVRLQAGMSMADAHAALNGIGIDLAPALVSYYPAGESPGPGVCWEMPDVNLVVWLYSNNGTVTSIGYWTERGFGFEPERSAWGLVMDTAKHSVLIGPTMQAGEVRTY